MRQAFAACVPLALAHLVVGWSLGYRSPSTYLFFWSTTACLLIAAARIVDRVFSESDPLERVMRIALAASAIAIVGGLALGAAGLLTPWAILAVAAAPLLVSWRLAPNATPGVAAPRLNIPIWIAGFCASMVVFVAVVGTMTWPPIAYDSLSYHLLFPARWLQEHRLSIVATPFSDEAQAYAPADGEVLFAWMMLPFHGDLVSRVGQLPFYVFAGAALFALARRAGARPAHASYATAFFFVSRPMVEQAVGADVDVICLAAFLASLYFGLVAVERNERRDWAFWGICLGLFWGTKYVALVYTPIVVLLAVMRGVRVRTMWALPGVAALALPWYIRNWAIGGSPIYPASLKLAGIALATGAYDRSAMLQSVFHVTDLKLLPVVVAHAFGTPLFLVWIPFAIIGAVSLLTRQPWWPGAFLLAAPLAMLPLFWFSVPDNIDSRFVLPAVATAMLPLPFVFGADRRWNAVVHAAFGAALIWCLVGVNAVVPMHVPWFMDGWLTLQGVLPMRIVPLFCLVAIVAAVAFRIGGPWGTTALASAAAIAFAAIGLGSCPHDRCEILQITPNFVRETMTDGWAWVRENTHDATFAYTGNNVPYPITGERLTNRVAYVNIDRHADWRFHDYAHARAKHPEPIVPALARSSGVLVAADPASSAGTVRPRYERMVGYRDAWLDNLRRAGAGYLFISALSAYEVDYEWHDDRGFPIEEQWAEADPAAFEPVYRNPSIRIYRVALR